MDVALRDAGGGAGFTLEAPAHDLIRGRLGHQDLDRDQTVEGGLASEVDGGNGARPEGPNKLELGSQLGLDGVHDWIRPGRLD